MNRGRKPAVCGLFNDNGQILVITRGRREELGDQNTYTLLILCVTWVRSERTAEHRELCFMLSGERGRKSQREGTYVHVWLIHLAAQWKATQLC